MRSKESTEDMLKVKPSFKKKNLLKKYNKNKFINNNCSLKKGATG